MNESTIINYLKNNINEEFVFQNLTETLTLSKNIKQLLTQTPERLDLCKKYQLFQLIIETQSSQTKLKEKVFATKQRDLITHYSSSLGELTDKYVQKMVMQNILNESEKKAREYQEWEKKTNDLGSSEASSMPEIPIEAYQIINEYEYHIQDIEKEILMQEEVILLSMQ